MRPGPDIIIACPACGALAKVFSLMSGNTFGASIWTDGKMEAPMLPRPPAITRCPSCDTIYWVADAKEVGKYATWETKKVQVDPAWENAPKIRELTENEYYEALDSGLATTAEREKQLRVFTWWRSNDRYRKDAALYDYSPDARCKQNMSRLFDLLQPDNVNERIMKAELARELGNFEDSTNLLSDASNDETEIARSFIMALCDKRVMVVKQLPARPTPKQAEAVVLAPNASKPTKRCPDCGKLLRSDKAQQCFECGADWHSRPA
jgi:hypothetical protein